MTTVENTSTVNIDVPPNIAFVYSINVAGTYLQVKISLPLNVKNTLSMRQFLAMTKRVFKNTLLQNASSFF